MPGANCAFPDCFTLRYTKDNDIGIFKLFSRSGDFYKQLKNDFLSVLCKYREVEDNLKKRISSLVFALLRKDDIWLMSFKILLL